MIIQFYKYQGTGNDFVIVDNRNGDYSQLTQAQIQRLCDRRFGIGGDGFMMLNASPDYDFEMVYFNADGRPGSMCGNGGRCIVQFAADQKIGHLHYRFLASDGPHEADIEDEEVSLKMKNVAEIQSYKTDHILNTGSPHYVQLDAAVMKLDVVKEGQKIRYHPDFAAEGINVNFVEVMENNDLKVRTYERGVEDETYSCGTGVTAAALVFHHNDYGFNSLNIITLGGVLNVRYRRETDGSYNNIWLKGSAVKVFEGALSL